MNSPQLMSSSDTIDTNELSNTAMENDASGHNVIILVIRTFAVSIVAIMLLFLFNNYLNFWRQWPGLPSFFSHQGWYGMYFALMWLVPLIDYYKPSLFRLNVLSFHARKIAIKAC
jgi:hypothetical protein